MNEREWAARICERMTPSFYLESEQGLALKILTKAAAYIREGWRPVDPENEHGPWLPGAPAPAVSEAYRASIRREYRTVWRADLRRLGAEKAFERLLDEYIALRVALVQELIIRDAKATEVISSLPPATGEGR